jgi:phospholipase C
MKNRLGLCVALALLAGCSGGGSSSVAPRPPAGNGQRVNATFKITIPNGGSSQQSGTRKPLFVSPSSNGMLVNVYVAGSGDKTPIASAAVNIGPGSGACTSGSGSRTCTVVVAAPVGSDDFIFTDYDKAPVAGSFVGAKELSAGSALGVTIAAGVANTISVTLDGDIATIKLASNEISFNGNGKPQTADLSLTALDADGNVITADPYLYPITVSVTETNGSGHTRLSLNGGTASSSVTVTQPSDAVVVLYDGDGSASPPYYAKLSVATTGVYPQTVQVSPLFVTTSPAALNFTQPGQTATLTMTQQTFSGAKYTLTSTNCTQLSVLTFTEGSNSEHYNITSGSSDATPCTLVASDGVTHYDVAVNPTNAGGSVGVPPGTVPSPQPGISKIQHVVFIIQENRSFDNMFHGFPGADTASQGYDSNGNVVPLSPISIGAGISPGHLHDDWVEEYNAGNMNGWNIDATENGVPEGDVYSYINPSQVKLYFNIGEAYTVGDRYFTTSNGASFAQHQYLIAAQANNTEDTPQLKGVSRLQAWGCDSPIGTTVDVLDPLTGLSTPNLTGPFPCFDYPTMADQLMAKGLESNFYAVAISGTTSGQPNYGQFSAYDAIEHISCIGGTQPCSRSSYWTNNVISPPEQVLTDIPAGKLGAVTWVDCDIYATCDHPLQTDTTSPEWPTDVIDAIGKSKFWDTTAIFLIWDDWGGFYDHVVPPQPDELGLGMRTGLVVVSPYAKNGYVSHVQHEHGSLLKFAEEAFGLKTMGATDSRADDLRDCFNFNQSPQAFKGPFDVMHSPQYFEKRLMKPSFFEP